MAQGSGASLLQAAALRAREGGARSGFARAFGEGRGCGGKALRGEKTPDFETFRGVLSRFRDGFHEEHGISMPF